VKRHPHLQPLSDDHHTALVLARRMRRAAEEAGDPAGLAKTWEDARASFARELAPHFRVEEEQLFPPLADAGETALVARAREDHACLRQLIGSAPTAANAVAFGKRLHRHVRFEERELFPRAEAILSLPVLEAAGRAALAARGKARA
jgi:hemerythrin-like domain-containing protein